MNNELLDQYETLRTLIESLQKDIVKHSQGNKSAGLRVRKDSFRSWKEYISFKTTSEVSPRGFLNKFASSKIGVIIFL